MARVAWVDVIRGLAIVLMVVFHFCYDLRYFGWVDWNVPNGSYWRPFRYVILTLFIFTTGMSLWLANQTYINWQKYLIRLVQMLAAALGITMMSLFVFPNAWIYFGILHFLTMVSFVGLFFLRMPLVAWVLGGFILLLYWSGSTSSSWPFHYFSWVPYRTEDYVPIFPWLGVSLLGIAFAAMAPIAKFDRMLCFVPSLFAKPLGRLGRHGLMVYILHQPILFAGFYLVSLASQ